VYNDFRYSHIPIDAFKFTKNNKADLEFSICEIKNEDVEYREIDNHDDRSLGILLNILFFIDHITYISIIQFSLNYFCSQLFEK